MQKAAVQRPNRNKSLRLQKLVRVERKPIEEQRQRRKTPQSHLSNTTVTEGLHITVAYNLEPRSL